MVVMFFITFLQVMEEVGVILDILLKQSDSWQILTFFLEGLASSGGVGNTPEKLRCSVIRLLQWTCVYVCLSGNCITVRLVLTVIDMSVAVHTTDCI